MLVYVPFISEWARPLYVPEATPAIVTLFDVPCIPWFGWKTLITLEPLVVLKALFFIVLVGKLSLVNTTAPEFAISKSHLLNLNLISSFWSAVHVVPFCDLNNTPAYGCSDIVLSELIWVSPIRATQAL